jgi:hypothetical protein
LTAQPSGTQLDLGGGDSVLFQGRTLAEFSANDFQVVVRIATGLTAVGRLTARSLQGPPLARRDALHPE